MLVSSELLVLWLSPFAEIGHSAFRKVARVIVGISMASRDKLRVLVTGGAGFLGSFLCERLVQEDHDVICVDNFYTGRRENIFQLTKCQNFEILRHDITFPLYAEVDQIYNLACPASPVHYQNDPFRRPRPVCMAPSTCLGSLSAVAPRFCRPRPARSMATLGCIRRRKTYWGHVNPIGPRACYDEAKRCAETLFFDYYRQHRTRIKVARIFNTYGPRMLHNDGRVVSNFVVQALQGEPITIYGDGSQTRSFCYVDDLIDGLIRLMNSPDEVTGPVNLGNPQEVTVRELAEEIIALSGSRSTLSFHPLPQNDPVRRRPDISLATSILGWQPRVPRSVGLEKTVEYFQARLRDDSVPFRAK